MGTERRLTPSEAFNEAYNISDPSCGDRVTRCATCGMELEDEGAPPSPPNPVQPDVRCHPECAEYYWDPPGPPDPLEGDR